MGGDGFDARAAEVAVSVGLLGDHRLDQVMQTWPSGVVEFYTTKWPSVLRTDQLLTHTVPIAVAGVFVMLLGGLAAHASYRRYSPTVRRLEIAG